jgi:oligopeptidase B
MNNPTPPVAKTERHVLEAHGHERVDPYYWMRERESEEVMDYLKAENAYREEMTAHTTDGQQRLFEEMKARIKEKDESLPYRMDGYWYQSRYEEGWEYPLFARRKGSLDAPEEIVLDLNERAEGQNYYQVAGLKVSPDHNLLAFGEDLRGDRIVTIHFKDLQTGKILEDKIEGTTGSCAWASDNHTLFYVTLDQQTLRPHRIYKHRLGTPASEDELVYEEKDETFIVTISRSKSKEYLFISSHATMTSEYRYLKADTPDGEWQVLEPREREHEYSVEHAKGHFYILTNWEAQNFRLMRTEVGQTARQHWQEVIAHRAGTMLEGIETFEQFLVLEERTQGLTQLRIRSWDGEKDTYLDFGEPTYTASISQNPEFETNVLRYQYNSLTTPASVFDLNMDSGEKTLMKQQEVLGGFNPEDYQAERIWATAPDGVKVPISLVYKKGLKRDGSAPLYLTGYGAYGISYDVYFSTVRLSLLNRGFVCAIAHIRGGEDLGRPWYEDGRLFNKKNTFTDFITCADYLVSEGYTKHEQLVIQGGSAGGLLIGAVINERPDVCGIAVAHVPFVDVVTTMLDDSIPLTTGEYTEWGNPNEKEAYDYILSYSPYDQVEAKEYPAMLVTTGFNDSQVQYWEPSKWVAKLRANKTDQNPLLYKIELEVGHAGKSGRFEHLKDVVIEYAFVLDRLGIRF